MLCFSALFSQKFDRLWEHADFSLLFGVYRCSLSSSPQSRSHLQPPLGILLPVGISWLKGGHRARLSEPSLCPRVPLPYVRSHMRCTAPSVHLCHVGVSICFCWEEECLWIYARTFTKHNLSARLKFVCWAVCVLSSPMQIPGAHWKCLTNRQPPNQSSFHLSTCWCS